MSALGLAWRLNASSYVVRVPDNAVNGSSGRRWYAIARGAGLGHFRNKRNAKAAVRKSVSRARGES